MIECMDGREWDGKLILGNVWRCQIERKQRRKQTKEKGKIIFFYSATYPLTLLKRFFFLNISHSCCTIEYSHLLLLLIAIQTLFETLLVKSWECK